MHHEVMVAKGVSYLTDAKGALYTFNKDTPVKSACAGDCAPEWPPYYYFARDAAPGDTKADVVKEIWLLAKP